MTPVWISITAPELLIDLTAFFSSSLVWKRIRPILEKVIHDTLQKRARERRAALLTARRGIVETLYNTHKASLPPKEWKYLPRVFDLCKLEPFTTLINASSETEVVASDFEPAMKNLPEILRQYKETRLEAFRSQVSSSPGLPAGKASDSDQRSPEIDVLDLAVTVFQCCRTHYFPHSNTFPVIGVEDILSHHCDTHRAGLPNPTSYGESRTTWFLSRGSGMSLFYEGSKTFNQLGSQVSKILVGLAGLDAQNALATDMDRKNLRFHCDQCQKTKGTQTDNNLSFTWRAAVSPDIYPDNNIRQRCSIDWTSSGNT